MAILHWKPDDRERSAVVSAIFSASASEEKIEELIRLYAHRPIAFFTQLESMVKRHVAASVIARSATDLGSVVRDSQRYLRYIQTALAASTVSTDSLIDELARKLDASFDAAGLTYLTDIVN
jgi:hypothetical protein